MLIKIKGNSENVHYKYLFRSVRRYIRQDKHR